MTAPPGCHEMILSLPDAPKVANRSVAAEDLLAIMRSLIDAAGERAEGESVELMRRVKVPFGDICDERRYR